MDKSSENKSYERAALYRDKISSLREIQRSQSISGFARDRDAISIHCEKKEFRIGITSVRGGWIVRHENFIRQKEGISKEFITFFLSSHYLFIEDCPPVILIEEKLDNKKDTIKIVSVSRLHWKKGLIFGLISINNLLRK